MKKYNRSKIDKKKQKKPGFENKIKVILIARPSLSILVKIFGPGIKLHATLKGKIIIFKKE